MKKIILAMVIVGATVVAQAAAVSWSAGSKVYKADGTAMKGAATAYVYLIANKATYDAIAVSDIWKDYGSKFVAGTLTPSATKNSNATSSKIPAATTDASANTTYYAVIVTTYGTGADLKYISEKAAVTTGDDGNGAYATIASAAYTTAGAATAWQSVGGPEPTPEPTSAMLLLLGVASLALRRRHS